MNWTAFFWVLLGAPAAMLCTYLGCWYFFYLADNHPLIALVLLLLAVATAVGLLT